MTKCFLLLSLPTSYQMLSLYKPMQVVTLLFVCLGLTALSAQIGYIVPYQ